MDVRIYIYMIFKNKSVPDRKSQKNQQHYDVDSEMKEHTCIIVVAYFNLTTHMILDGAVSMYVCELDIYCAHIKCVNRTKHIFCHEKSELGEQI
jgi:hypothetical protein